MQDEFFQAVLGGDVETVKRMLQEAPELATERSDGNTPLHAHVEGGQTGWDSHTIMILLIEHGADINAQNQEGNTALHLAVKHLHEVRRRMGNDEEASRALISLLGLDPALDIENNEGQTAWYEAFGCDEDQVCFWIDEADWLQKARQANVSKIHYTVSQADEGPEIQNIEAFDQNGERVPLSPNEMASYEDYFLARRNGYGGLGEFDPTWPGDFVWDVSKRQVFTRFAMQPSVEPPPLSVDQVDSVADIILCLGTSERAKATVALLAVGESAVDLLCGALENPSWHVAAAAAYVLGKIGKTSAVEPLVQIIEQKRFFVTEAAVWALGQIGDARCIEPIVNLLSDWNAAVDVDVVTMSAGALGHFVQEASSFLNKVVDEGVSNFFYGEAAALAILSRMPGEVVLAPMIRLLLACEFEWEEIECALGQIGWIAAKPLVDLYFDPPNNFDPDSVARALGWIDDARVVDLVFDYVQQDNSQAIQNTAAKMLIDILNDSSHELVWHFAERLLPITLSLHDEYNQFAWEVLEYCCQPEPLRHVIQLVFDRWDATGGSHQECDEAIAQAITDIAALSEVAAPSTALNSEDPAPPSPSDEERIMAMLDGQIALLKPLSSLSAAAAFAALFDQYQKTHDDPAEALPFIKAMVYCGPEAIEELYGLRDNYEDGTVPEFARKALEALNIPALGAKAVPPLLRALRRCSYPGDKRTEIWDHLVSIGPVAVSGIEHEMSLAEKSNSNASYSAGHIDLGTLSNIRKEIYEEMVHV